MYCATEVMRCFPNEVLDCIYTENIAIAQGDPILFRIIPGLPGGHPGLQDLSEVVDADVYVGAN